MNESESHQACASCRFSLRTMLALTAIAAMATATYAVSPEVAVAAGAVCLAVNLLNLRDILFNEVSLDSAALVTAITLLIMGVSLGLLGLVLRDVEAGTGELLRGGICCIMLALPVVSLRTTAAPEQIPTKSARILSSDPDVCAEDTDDALR